MKDDKKEQKKDDGFPLLVYKCPGPHIGEEGSRYDYKSAANQEQLDKLLKDGWSKTQLEAIEAAKLEKATAPAPKANPAK